MRRYIVTGATGYLGSNVVELLTAKGEQVRAFALPGDKAAGLLPPSCEVVYGNILKPEDIERLFEGLPNEQIVVIHCAGIITMSLEPVPIVYNVNVNGTRNIVAACVRHQVHKLIHVSSVHAITETQGTQVVAETDHFDPQSVHGYYAKTKAEATQAVYDAVRNQGLPACVIFPAGIAGPGDTAGGHFTQLFIDYFQGRIPAGVIGGYSFADVRDVAQAIVACVDRGSVGEGYILGGHYVTVRDIFTLLHLHGAARKINLYVPLWLARLILPVMSLWYKLRKQKAVFSRYSLYTLGTSGRFSSEKARRQLGYAPRPFEQTVMDTIAWLKKEGKI